MTTTTATPAACQVLRCSAPAAWLLTITDDGQTVTRDPYCAGHAAERVRSMARPGRRLTLDAAQQ